MSLNPSLSRPHRLSKNHTYPLLNYISLRSYHHLNHLLARSLKVPRIKRHIRLLFAQNLFSSRASYKTYTRYRKGISSHSRTNIRPVNLPPYSLNISLNRAKTCTALSRTSRSSKTENTSSVPSPVYYYSLSSSVSSSSSFVSDTHLKSSLYYSYLYRYHRHRYNSRSAFSQSLSAS